jgi:hypothetical protein
MIAVTAGYSTSAVAPAWVASGQGNVFRSHAGAAEDENQGMKKGKRGYHRETPGSGIKEKKGEAVTTSGHFRCSP